MTFQGCFLPSFDSFGKAVSEKKIFYKSTNQKQEMPVVTMWPPQAILVSDCSISKNLLLCNCLAR
jgi:hypothetical protein